MANTPDTRPTFEFNEKVARSFLDNASVAGGLHGYLGFETVDVGPGTMQGRFQVREEYLRRLATCMAAF